MTLVATIIARFRCSVRMFEWFDAQGPGQAESR